MSENQLKSKKKLSMLHQQGMVDDLEQAERTGKGVLAIEREEGKKRKGKRKKKEKRRKRKVEEKGRRKKKERG